MTQVAKIIIHHDHRFLLQLRDNNPNIAFPLHWNLLGGVVEDSETPEQTIRRELKEELGIDIKRVKPFSVEEYNGTTQHIFSAKANMDPSKIKLNEGLALRWFTIDELASLKIGFNYYKIIQKFIGQNG